LKRHNLEVLQSIFTVIHSAQGYGRVTEIPAVYGLLWNTPNMMQAILRRVSGTIKGTGM